MYAQLHKAQRGYDRAQAAHVGLGEKEKNIETELGNIPEGHPSKRQKTDELLRIRNQLENSRAMMESHSCKIDSLNGRLMEARLITPPDSPEESEASSESSSEEEVSMERDEATNEEEAPTPMNVEGAKPQAKVVSEEVEIQTTAVEENEPITEVEDCVLDGDETPIAFGVIKPAGQIAGDMSQVSMEPPVTEAPQDPSEDLPKAQQN